MSEEVQEKILVLPRRAGKSFMSALHAELIKASVERMVSKNAAPSKHGPTLEDLMTPGFHSGFPDTWASNKKSKSPETEEKTEMVEEPIDKMDEDYIAANIDIFMSDLNRAISRMANKSYMLTAPGMHTVKSKDGQFSKRAHMGGETFNLSAAYMGKRNKIIFQLAPVDVALYEVLEIGEDAARRLFPAMWDDLMTDQDAGFAIKGVAEFKRLLVVDARKKEEKEKLKHCEELYEDFGSW